MQTSIGISALGAAYFHKLRTGERQEVKVNARHAIIEFSESLQFPLVLLFLSSTIPIMIVRQYPRQRKVLHYRR